MGAKQTCTICVQWFSEPVFQTIVKTIKSQSVSDSSLHHIPWISCTLSANRIRCTKGLAKMTSFRSINNKRWLIATIQSEQLTQKYCRVVVNVLQLAAHLWTLTPLDTTSGDLNCSAFATPTLRPQFRDELWAKWPSQQPFSKTVVCTTTILKRKDRNLFGTLHRRAPKNWIPMIA